MISFEQFLKQYTAVSNKFVDKYYKFEELCKENIFGIEGSQVIEYLGLRNHKKFYEILKEDYDLNKDYIIKTTTEKNKIYYLTFDCFEKICMSSDTKQGDAVRDYFIQSRKFIEYNRALLADTINNLEGTTVKKQSKKQPRKSSKKVSKRRTVRKPSKQSSKRRANKKT